MWAKPVHEKSEESSRGVSSEAVVPGVGKDGSNTIVPRSSLSGRRCCCGDAERLGGGRRVVPEGLVPISHGVEGKFFNFIGSRRVAVRGHARNCGGPASRLEIRRGRSRGPGTLFRVENVVVRVGECVKK